MIVVITNLGNVSYLVKKDNYDYPRAIDIYNDAVAIHNKGKTLNDYQEAAEDHLDCDTIADYNGSKIVVYAFTLDPKYNYALKGYRKTKKLDNQQILKGISSDGLNSLISLA